MIAGRVEPESGRRAAVVTAGVVGCLIALLSAADMLVPKAFDGVVPEPYSDGGIVVRDVVPESGADRAGLRPGDTVLGIGHRILRGPKEAPAELRRHAVGDAVSYLVKRGENVFETDVSLSPFRAGSVSYFTYVLLGAAFFALGVFVYTKRPEDPAAAVFCLLSTLFMLFFACRLRPLSYYWIDYFVQAAGTLALFLLPAVFLHFFLLFPARKVFHFADTRPGEPPPRPAAAASQTFLNGSPLLLTLLYTLPPAVYLLQMAAMARSGTPVRLIYGAPVLNWILLAGYLVLGVLALFHSWLTAADRTQRRQILVLLIGTLGGTLPFVVFAVSFPSLFREERYLAWGVLPMALVPLTFGYAIVRFRLFDVRVIVRKSLVYGTLTAVVTGLYALVVVAGSRAASSSFLISAPWFGIAFAFVVVLLVDPLRRRMQAVVDRLFFRDRADFQRALLDVSREVASQLERDKLRLLLTDRTAALLRLESLELLTPRPEDGALEAPRGAGEASVHLPVGSVLGRRLVECGGPLRLAEVDPADLDAPSREFHEAARAQGVRVLVPVSSRGRLLGLMAAGAKKSEEDFGPEDLDHLATVANQGALGLEAASLHEELTRRAEVQRDLEIARDIQTSLFPRTLPEFPGIEMKGVSLPAKVVGGDFYDVLPVGGPGSGRFALALGDVSGKSIPASLLMVAAKEIVHARASVDPDPAAVFLEANRRIYDIKRRMFVSLGYFLYDPDTLSFRYTVAGQPLPLLVRDPWTEAVEIPAPESRLPLGALRGTEYDSRTVYLKRGDLLLFYTDGLSEAMSSEMSDYGEGRLKASLVRHAARPLEEMAEELLEDVRQFTFGAEQYDDQTFVLLRVGGTKPANLGDV